MAHYPDRAALHTKAVQHAFLAGSMDVELSKTTTHQNRVKCTWTRGPPTSYSVAHCGARRPICKVRIGHIFNVSEKVVQAVAKQKAATAEAHMVPAAHMEPSNPQGRRQHAARLCHPRHVRHLPQGPAAAGEPFQ